MGCDVYANSNAIACKAGDGKVIAAFPDVCLSPPSPPAGPVPVPYPNTSFDKDMQNGSKTVTIKGKEVMLKDQSFFKTSPLGDEAATRSFGGSVVTHVITGKTYFKAWSMDVRFEGQNVDRNLDLTGSNQASDPPSPPPVMPKISEVQPPPPGPDPEKCPCCKGPKHEEEKKSGPMTEEQWYKPHYPDCPPNPREKAAMKLYDEIKAGAKADGCDYLFHDDPNDPCAKHYIIKSAKSGREEFEAMMQPLTRKQNPSYFMKRYGTSLGKKIKKRGARLTEALRKGAVSIAHRTPLAAGGCPVGGGNLKPVEEKCLVYEKLLGDPVQNVMKQYHIRANGL